MIKKGQRTVEIDIDGIKIETERAILVIIDYEEIWLPKSQIEYDMDLDKDQVNVVTATEWIAEQKGLI